MVPLSSINGASRPKDTMHEMTESDNRASIDNARYYVSCIVNFSPHVREYKTVLDSGFHAVDSGFQLPDSRTFFSGTWIPDSNC